MLKSFRKSRGDGSKHDIKTNFISIPQKDAIAIVPPKRVIKALYDYNAPTDPPHYLSFSQGDFLHVVARENDQDWYEACNPLQGTRGLVPVKYFETVGKTARDSRGSDSSAPHDSGYSDSSARSPNGPAAAGHRLSKSIGKMGMGGAMVYGIVAFDFHAERPDELDAKEGEAIIVIAQSNPEWFVAKPITRLGGPGLIPVSFIEIKDMQTGKTVTDPSEAIAKAGIPRVEEWKKMAADYKNTSIALGHFSVGPQAEPTSNPMDSLNQAMARSSMAPGVVPPRSPLVNSGSAAGTPAGNAVIAPVKAGVPRFIYADEKFHFIVECTMSNGTTWDLSRIYENFYELQINLIKAFPEEAGQTGQPRTLPYMPGPVQFVTDKISEGRRENLDEYLQHLLCLGPHITKSPLLCSFFAPRAGDYEVDTNDAAQRNGAAQHSRQPSAPGGHYRNPSEFSQASAPPMQRQMTQGSAASGQGMTPSMTPAMTPGPGGAALKVKVWFDRDTCVVVRMPAKGTFKFADMYKKILERRRLEYTSKKAPEGANGAAGADPNLEIEYRDERDGEYYKLSDDDELTAALETNDKLTLVVREIAS